MKSYYRPYFFLLLIVSLLVGCGKISKKRHPNQKKMLEGAWNLIRTEADIATNDDEASGKIALNMESEMSVLRTKISFDSINQFTVISKLDSLEMKKDGEYEIVDDKLIFSFVADDKSIISFKYDFEVIGDSLYIIFDNLDHIEDVIKSKTFSDNNLKLMYGIKNRELFELSKANVKRIYARDSIK